MKKTNIKLTDKEKQIINNLYKFRFLTIKHFQKILKHKNHHRINEWLKSLEEKQCVKKIDYPNDVTKPSIFCLDTKARLILKEGKNINKNFLKNLYKEKNVSEKFIGHFLSLVDIFLLLESKKENPSINYFAKHQLKNFKYFPDELPDSYISSKKGDKVSRYFLHLFESYTPNWSIRKIVKNYISYFDNNNWQDNTKSNFPTILFVFSNEKSKGHIYHYAKAKLGIYDELSFYLTTKEKIESMNFRWEKVEK